MGKLFKRFEYGSTANSYDWLKALALATMIIDHLGKYFFPELEWLRVIGRIAAPIFLFLVGYNGNFSFNRYLLAGAVIVSGTLYITGEGVFSLNILWSILVWRMLMGLLAGSPQLENELPALWFGLLVFYIPSVLILEYGTIGLMFALLGWQTRQGRRDTTTRACWLTAFALWVGMQSAGFQFDAVQVGAFALQSAVLFWCMAHFRLIPAPAESALRKALHLPVILLARNTLVLYVAHVVLFAFVSYWWHQQGHIG